MSRLQNIELGFDSGGVVAALVGRLGRCQLTKRQIEIRSAMQGQEPVNTVAQQP